MRRTTTFLVALLAGLAAAAPVAAQSSVDAPPTDLEAARLDAPLAVDGRLDEAVWAQAAAATGFRQFEPVEGAAPSYRTEVRVLYGPGDLYVGALLFDDDPAAVERTLGRRDEINRADWFLVSIDSYFDRRTAYVFGLNAAGVQFDAVRTSGTGGPGEPDGNLPGADVSWDAIWESAVRLTPEGWALEMRIPYSMLRFPEAEAQTWGIHFTRRIPRLGEQGEWPLVPRTERTNLVARFGLLTGIADVEPRRNVQIRPYTVTRLHTSEDFDAPGTTARDGSIDAGVDLKVGLGPNVTLDASVNPDFGQVESDPAVLNLTAFETVFEERRPFFVEGAQIYDFQVGPGRLLYTRRIGADAPIVGAAKLSGRTAGGLSFGVLGAATGDDFDPSRHYGLARMSQQIGAYSSVGGIWTGFDAPGLGPDGRRRSLAGGVDWDIRLGGNRYGLEGFAALTHRRLPAAAFDDETGVAGKIWARRRQGAVTGFVGFDVFSDTFNPNDMGQLGFNNFIALLNSIDIELNGSRPFGPFLRGSLSSFTFQQFSYDEGRDLGMRITLGSQWLLRGFQQVELGVSGDYLFGGYDLFETRGLGPWAPPRSFGIEGEIETDGRRSWLIEPEGTLIAQEGGGRAVGLGLRWEWNAGTRLSLTTNLEGAWEDDFLAWSSNEAFRRTPDGWTIGRATGVPDDPDAFVAFDDGGRLDAILGGVPSVGTDTYFVPVFGTRDTRSIDLTLRGDVTFRPTLSLQLYSQLFLARGRYDAFRILQTPDVEAAFDAFPKRDEFALSSLQSNVVARWEYRPGSVFFLVWTHGRRADDALNPLAPWGPSPADRPLGDQAADTFDLFPDNVFLVKLNYTVLY